MKTEAEIFNVNANVSFTMAEVKEIAETFASQVARRTAKTGNYSDLTGFWDLMKSSKFADDIRDSWKS